MGNFTHCFARFSGVFSQAVLTPPPCKQKRLCAYRTGVKLFIDTG